MYQIKKCRHNYIGHISTLEGHRDMQFELKGLNITNTAMSCSHWFVQQPKQNFEKSAPNQRCQRASQTRPALCMPVRECEQSWAIKNPAPRSGAYNLSPTQTPWIPQRTRSSLKQISLGSAHILLIYRYASLQKEKQLHWEKLCSFSSISEV